MKKHLRLIIFLLVTVLICVGTLPLTLAGSQHAKTLTPSHNEMDSEISYHNAAVMIQEPQTYHQEVDKVLKRYDSLELDPKKVAEEVRRTGRLRLPTSDGAFDLKLELNDMRADRYVAQATLAGGEVQRLERQPVHTYKGTVAGMPGAQARLTIDGSTLEGVIITPSQLYFVEAAKRYSSSAKGNDFLVYKDSDVIATSFGECGVTLAEEVRQETLRVKTQIPKGAVAERSVTEELFTPPRVVDLATDADFEYFQANGSDAADTNSEIINIMNQVEGIYDAHFGLQFNIVFQNVFTMLGDPYSDTTSPATLLDEFRDFWNDNRGSVSRDLAHLWTGRNFDGTTIGIAFRPGIDCPFEVAGFGYGISQIIDFTPEKFILSAHEIGHNFNATHSDSEAGCTNTIMNATLSSSTLLQFCTFSVNQIQTHADAQAVCLPQGINPNCTYSLSPPNQSFPVGGGNGSVSITTTGTDCVWGATSTVSWITITSANSGVNSATINFSVASNNNGFARTGILRIAEQNATVNQAGGAGCNIVPINIGQTINAALANTDCRSGQRPNSFADQYSFSGTAGQQIRIEMSNTTPPPGFLDTYLYLFAPNGSLIAENDDIVLGDVTNSRIPQDGTLFTLPQTGTYIIESTSFDDNETGNYSLALIGNTPVNSVSFSSGSFTVSEGVDGNGIGFEGTGFRTITAQRAGDVSGPATVDYLTSGGTADPRKDYTQALGTLRFGANETTKTFAVFIIDDAFQEGAETVNLSLSNPVGTTLGATPTAVLTINSNDASSGPSPVKSGSFNSRFFVRQHYLDFLNREPDLGGINFWVGQTTGCGNPDPRVCQVNVSAAFYVSIEFQETGYLVYRMFKAAYGDTTSPGVAGTVPIINLLEFLPDTQRIGQGVMVGVGNWQQQLEDNKNAYAAEFVARQRFLTDYPLSLTPAQFVDQLNSRSGGALSQAERDNLVNGLTGGTLTRGQVVRSVAEDQTLRDAEFRRAFVLMQFFGYMRRNPDDAPDTNFGGWRFWLDKLDQFNGNFVQAEMVRAFLDSIEYGDRFGQ